MATPQQAAAKGKGWVDKNNPNYGTPGFVGPDDEDGADAGGVPPPPDGVPGRLAAPTLGPLTVPPPPDGVTGAPTPPSGPMTAPGRLALPPATPLVDNAGTATHQTEIGANGGPDLAEPTSAAPTLNSALKDALLKMLGQGDPTMNDPTIAAQSGAFGVQQQRAKERARSAMAERFAADGGPGVDSGAFDSGILGMEQRQGEAQGAFDADLMSKELTERRNNLLSAAALAGNQLNESERLSFQKELAKVDEELQRMRIGQTGQGLALDAKRLDEASKQWNQQFGMEGQKLAESIRQFDTTTQAGRDQLKQQLEMFKTQMGEQGRQFDVDAELKRLGINQQGALGQGDLDLRRFLGEGNLNLGLLQALFQNNQFGQGLGAQLGMFNQTSNNNFLQSLLAALGQAA